MQCRVIEHDIFTYNTLIDVVCKGGQMELVVTIMMLMHQKSITPNVVNYNTVINGYANVTLFQKNIIILMTLCHAQNT